MWRVNEVVMLEDMEPSRLVHVSEVDWDLGAVPLDVTDRISPVTDVVSEKVSVVDDVIDLASSVAETVASIVAL